MRRAPNPHTDVTQGIQMHYVAITEVTGLDDESSVHHQNNNPNSLAIPEGNLA